MALAPGPVEGCLSVNAAVIANSSGLKQRHFIDSHKGCTLFAVLGMMALHDAWGDISAWLYLAEHGLYGLLWVIKSRTFGDRQWDTPCTPARALVIWSALSLYWVAPWLITSRHVALPPWYAGLSVALFGLGIFCHFAADMQKHMHLALRPGTLLCDGLWARCRNPNYFGELLIYLSFCMLARHWAPLVVLGLFVGVVWLPNMRRKDASLSRYPAFAAWKRRATLFIPFAV